MWPLKALDVKFWLKTDVLLWVSLGCIHFSPALASMGLIAYVFQLWVWGERVEEKGLIRWFWWGVALCVGWNMCVIWMSGYWPWSVGVGGVSGVTLDVAGGLLEKENEMGRMALNKVLIKLPLLLVAMAYGWGRRLRTIFGGGWFVGVLPLIWVGVSSVIHYFQHRTFYDQMVLESKPIPLYSGVYHIEFATMMGVIVLLMIRGLIQKDFRENYLAMASVAVLVICMHVLGSRTGLILVYIGGALMVGKWAYGRPAVRRSILLVFPLLILSMILLPSAKNRLTNTWDDFSTTLNGGDVTHKSFGQRWVAWKASMSVLGSTPSSAVIGAGVWTDDRLQKEYSRLDISLAERHRIGVHNQWLEMSLQSGWIVSALFFIFVFIGLRTVGGNAFNSNQQIWLAIVAAMMFESLLERQAGVLITIVALQVTLGTKITNNSQIKDENTLNI